MYHKNFVASDIGVLVLGVYHVRVVQLEWYIQYKLTYDVRTRYTRPNNWQESLKKHGIM